MLDEIDYSYYCRPCVGERVSGDITVIEQKDKLLFIAIIDGLGHGINAHNVAVATKICLQKIWSYDVCQTMIHLHENLKGSLGAAVGLSVLDLETDKLFYTGVGNTVIRLIRNQNKQKFSKKLYSADGIVGSNIANPVEQQLQLKKSDLILFYTDGVKENFTLEQYPLILSDETSIIPRKIVRNFGKTYDDATCIALKY
jgi:serine phosphatase RsbU (regulator of sigma subunit)